MIWSLHKRCLAACLRHSQRTLAPRDAILIVTCGLGSLAGIARADDETNQVNRMEEIVVVANKIARPLNAIPSQVTVLTADRMAFEQVQEFADIARYEPALEADFNSPRFGSSGVSIRGIGGNRVALEFDGVPLPQRYAVGNFADSSRLVLDPAIVERIEILRGPGSALYGSDAIGGVVAITSFDGTDLVRGDRSHYAGARTGYFGANNALLGSSSYAWAGEADSVLVAGSYRDGHEPDNRSHGVDDDSIDFDQWQGFGKWTHNFAFGGVLRLSLDYFERDTISDVRSLLGFARFANTTSLHGDDNQRRDRTTLSFEIVDRGWLDEASIMLYRQSNTTEQRTKEQRTSRGTPVLLQRDFSFRELDYGGELRTRRDFVTGSVSHVVVAGAEWDHQRLTEARDGSETNRITGVSRRSILGETFPLRDLPKSVTNEIGVYAQDEISIGAVTFVGAVRWDDFSLDASTDEVFDDPSRLTDLDTSELTFRAGATVRASHALNIYAHYAQGFRAPPSAEVNLFLDIPLFNLRALPNPDLKPERSDTVEAGLRVRTSTTTLDAAAYYTEYEDFIESRVNLGIDPVTGILIFQSRNLAQAHVYGTEASITQGLRVLHPRLDSLALEAGFHWARGENESADQPLNEVNPLKATFALRWEPGQLPIIAALRATHLGHQSRVDFSDTTFFVPPAATVLDFTLRFEPHPSVQAHLGIYNLTDKRYWRYADVRRFDPGDPRIEVISRPGTHAQFTVSFTF